MLSFTVILFTVLFALLGRFAFGRWYNHVTLYVVIWGTALTLFVLRLIAYYPLEEQTWLVIFAGSSAFLVGSLTVWAYRLATGRPVGFIYRREEIERYASPELQKALVRTLWFINGVTFLTVMQHWYVMAKIAGGVPQMILFSNLMYSFRIEYGIPGGIPYGKSLTLLGALFGGVLTALRGRPSMAAVAPLIIIFLGEIVSVGRSLLIQGGIFFVSGYFFCRYHYVDKSAKVPTRVKMQQMFALVIIFAMIITGMEFIRTNRGGTKSEFEGTTKTLERVNGAYFISPSLYLYLTSGFGVLNQYLKKDVEDPPWGANSFAPVYHILAKLGLDVKVSIYTKFYKTPVASNNGTYLREAHADFGILGVLLYPYTLGILASIAYFSLQGGFRYTVLTLVASLFAVVAMSLFMIILRGGDLYIVCLGGVVLGRRLDLKAGASESHILRETAS